MKTFNNTYFDELFINTLEHLLSPEGHHYRSPITATDDPEQAISTERYLELSPLKSKSKWRYILNHSKKQYADKHKGYDLLSLIQSQWSGDIISMEKDNIYSYECI
jgi:hypothetical protein